MLDLLLANKLVKAIPPGAHVLFVGDVDQLPSVGAGEVLRDLLAPGSFLPSVRLTRIFRQAARSGVVTNAHRINAGEYPQLRGLPDFFLFPADDADTAADGDGGRGDPADPGPVRARPARGTSRC